MGSAVGSEGVSVTGCRAQSRGVSRSRLCSRLSSVGSRLSNRLSSRISCELNMSGLDSRDNRRSALHNSELSSGLRSVLGGGLSSRLRRRFGYGTRGLIS